MKEIKEEFQHLVRIVNTDLEGNKQIAYALRKIKGVGFQFANLICSLSGIDKTKKVGYLSEEDIKKLDDVIKNPSKSGVPNWMLNRRRNYEDDANKHLITSDLDFAKDNDIKRMKKIKSYKGVRHMFGLPVRGQRTKSNFRRQKGNVLGVKRKAAAGRTGK
jgi:small subunit ribosomal protein S13